MKRNKQERDFIKEWKRSSLWHRIIICLSAVVMLGTRYMLILPAATMEGGQAAGANAAEWERALPRRVFRRVGGGSHSCGRVPDRVLREYGNRD